MLERDEQKLLDLVTRVAANPSGDEAYTELWVAARWLVREDVKDQIAMTQALLQADPMVRTLWATFLLDAFGKLERQMDDIADGVPFQHDGMTLRAVVVDV
jgi:hypothetical protein